MPGGHPTDYDPKYCAMLVKHMAKGLSFESFAGEIDVARATLYNWEKVHAKFLDAKRRGFDKNLAFWEKQSVTGLWNEKDGPTFNSTNFIFNMKNRHKWRDKPKEEEDEEKKEVSNPLLELLKGLSSEELLKMIRQGAKEKKEDA